jgi:hypothetical protein
MKDETPKIVMHVEYEELRKAMQARGLLSTTALLGRENYHHLPNGLEFFIDVEEEKHLTGLWDSLINRD